MPDATYLATNKFYISLLLQLLQKLEPSSTFAMIVALQMLLARHVLLYDFFVQPVS